MCRVPRFPQLFREGRGLLGNPGCGTWEDGVEVLHADIPREPFISNEEVSPARRQGHDEGMGDLPSGEERGASR